MLNVCVAMAEWVMFETELWNVDSLSNIFFTVPALDVFLSALYK